MKRLIALILITCMIVGLFPVYGTAKEAPADKRVLTQEDYRTADLMWEAVNEKEAKLRAVKAPVNETTEALIDVVLSSPYYEEDSLIRNGEFFAWQTVDGIACGYSPRLSQIAKDAKPLENYDPATAPTTITTNYSTRGGTPRTNEVFVIQPYYGLDSSFKEQYVAEGNSIASALNGKSTLYRTTSATIDAVADSMERGAVVIFDSHGDTDYAKGEDYTSQANTSYLCLQVGTGLTSEDYNVATGAFGSYYHAYYYGANGSMKYYCVDGTAISNHMDQKAQNSFLWMAICLSMATDGMQAPLRKKGVEVAYGYSQSVTFEYDYYWEEVFWDEMLSGSIVSDAIYAMKEDVGHWDWVHSSQYDTIAEARAGYCAFPIVVSSEDTYPGHGNVDDLQAVRSTWSLLPECPHSSSTYYQGIPATCTAEGAKAYYSCSLCGGLFTDKACTVRTTMDELILAPLGHSFDEGVETIPPTCSENGVVTYTCTRCSYSQTSTVLAMGHEYADGICLNCGQSKPKYTEFTPGVSGEYILAAKVGNDYYAMTNALTSTSQKYSASKIRVYDGFVAEEDAEGYVFTLNFDSVEGAYLIQANGLNLKYPSSTSLSGSTAKYYWQISAGVNGSWRVLSEVNTRCLAYRARGYNVFGAYYTGNISSGSTEYYDIEIIPVAKAITEPQCPHSNTRTDKTEANCESIGTVSIYCVDCGERLSYEENAPLGHAWDQGEVLSPVGCEQTGYTLYTCTRCSATKTEAQPPIGHNWSEAVVAPEASCTASGIKTYTCYNCSATRTEDIPEYGHSFDEGVEALAPTCTADGVLTYTCTRCGKTEEHSIPMTGHEFINEICIYCGIHGVETVTKFAPGVSGSFIIAAKKDDSYYGMKNNYASSGKIASEILDTEEGYVEESESYGFELEFRYDEESGKYSISNGVQYLRYSSGTNLGASDTPQMWTITPGTNGSWRIASSDPTRAVIFRAGSYKQFGGYSTTNITAGGEEYYDVEILPIRHYVAESTPTIDESIVINHSLNLASDISINYMIHTSLLTNYDSFYMECIVSNYDGNEELGSSLYYVDPVLRDQFYVFTLKGITAVQMGDEIYSVLKMENEEGSFTSTVDTYSIADYAYAQLNRSTTGESLKALCAQLLRYGAQAQTFKEYRTDTLVDSRMTEEQRAYLSDLEAVTFAQNNRVLNDLTDPIVTWAGKSLSLESKVVLKFIVDLSQYEGDSSELVLRVSYKDYTGELMEEILKYPQSFNADNSLYSFSLDTLLAADLRCVVSAAVYEGDTQVSPTLEYSPDSYGNGKTGGLKTLCQALMAYSDTALAYFTQG